MTADIATVIAVVLIAFTLIVFTLAGAVCFLATVVRDVRADAHTFELKAENRRIVKASTRQNQMVLPLGAAAKMIGDLDRGAAPRRRSPMPRQDTGSVEEIPADDLAHAGSAASNGFINDDDRPQRRLTTTPPE